MDWLDNNTVESHRLAHDSDLKWSLRRAFILKHGDKFPVHRLICLASCFINIERYGCRYPDKVMVQVRELTEGLQEVNDYRETRRSRTEVKFVKATEQTDEDASGNQTSPDVAVKPAMATTKSGLKGLMFVKSSDTTETGNEEGFNKETDKEGPTEQHRILFAGLQMDSKEDVGENMLKPQEDVDSEDLNCRPSFTIYITEEPSLHNSRQVHNPSEFFILEQEVQTRGQSAAGCILKNSTDLCKMSLDFDFTDLQTMQVRCQVSVAGRIIADACGINDRAALAASSEQALQHLREKYWTIMIKEDPFSGHIPSSNIGSKILQKIPSSNIGSNILQKIPSSNIGSNILQKIPSSNIGSNILQKIPSSNIGSKILQKMGWIGGGVGKTGQGIAEPITVNSVMNRKGLGFMAAKAAKAEKAEKRIQLKAEKRIQLPFLPILQRKAEKRILQQMRRQMRQTRQQMQQMRQTRQTYRPNAIKWSSRDLKEYDINREGLGFMAEKGIQILPKLQEVLQTFKSSSKEFDMTFSPCFTKEERALIHEEAGKLGSLNTRSHGTGDDRFLVVSRTISNQEVLQYIFQQGGETSEYKLIPPTTEEHL